MAGNIFMARFLFFLSGINFALSGIRFGLQDFPGAIFNLFVASFVIFCAIKLIKKEKMEESKNGTRN